ncbi:MAG: hypothetical protein Q7S08_01975 [bacterium]|nr:hypothetical protein [bacterium]
MLFPAIVFFLSLLGIVGLFVVKYLEEQKQKVLLPPVLRKKADEQAIQLKGMLLAKRAEVANLPGNFLHLAHVGVHVAALEAARFARYLEAQAHRLADFVSHKHHFKKGETRSEFLKQVKEHALNNNHNNGSVVGGSQNDSEIL